VKEALFTSHTEQKDTVYDFELNFLDDYTQDAVNQGAKLYDIEKKNSAISLTGSHHIVQKELNFTPYDRPKRAVEIATQPIVQTKIPTLPGETSTPKINVKMNSKKGRWTKGGFKGPEDEKPALKTHTKTGKYFYFIFKEINKPKVAEGGILRKSEKKSSIKKVEKLNKDKKKNKLKSALFAGVAKNSDSDDSSSDSDSSSGNDSEEERKTNKKKSKKKTKGSSDDKQETTKEKKDNTDDLFDMGPLNDIDPYKMMASETDDQILLGADSSPADILNDPSLVQSMAMPQTGVPSGGALPGAPVPGMPPGGAPQQFPTGVQPGMFPQPGQVQFMGAMQPGQQPLYGYPNQQIPGQPQNIPNAQNNQHPPNNPFGDLK